MDASQLFSTVELLEFDGQILMQSAELFGAFSGHK